MKRIALFGGSFNPPHLGHRTMAEALAASGFFDEIIVIPCGPRPDKATTNDITPVHRAALVDLTFADIPKTRVVLDDLEQDSFTRQRRLQKIFERDAEVWHVVGSDLLRGGGREASKIHAEWAMGAELWGRCNFAVFIRPDHPLDENDFPPHHRVFPMSEPVSSKEVRDRAFKHRPFEDLVPRRVADYIARHGLYRGEAESAPLPVKLANPRIWVVADEQSPEARALADRLSPLTTNDPDLLVVLGGDGFMLETVRKHWRRRIPFYGINFGHRGFLLNDRTDAPAPDYFERPLALYRTPLLYVEADLSDGTTRTGVAFNEALVNRKSKAAWLGVDVNNEERIHKLVGDGVLVATAAGSTGYALAMGAPPLLLGTPALLLVGSNVHQPLGWKYAVLRPDATIQLTTLDENAPHFRPIEAVVDDESWGEVDVLTVRASRVAAVELAFDATRDMTAKLAEIQFPQR